MNPHNSGYLDVNRHLSMAFVLLAAMLVLPGCSYLRSKFGGNQDAYKASAQTRPLEVPPDLELPNHSGSLVIPEPSPANTQIVENDASPALSIAPGATPPSVATITGGDTMQVADSVQNTWRRVGLALERSGIASIQSRDEVARTYEISTQAKQVRSPGWFKRVVTLGMARDQKVSTPVLLRVRVSGEDGASKVTIEGANSGAGDTAAREVLETLRQRMS